VRIVLFCHSLISDWNHGNAHFLRGVASELIRRGHSVHVLEPRDSWSATNLQNDYGARALSLFHDYYPALRVTRYDSRRLDLDETLEGADLVLVHEWNTPALIRAIGMRRARGGSFLAFFHDTHHRAISAHDELSQNNIDRFDAVLVFGAALREIYQRRGWGRRVFVWHEAADTRIFRPLPNAAKQGEFVWIGNWGDNERSRELREFVLDPVKSLELRAAAYGVRYPGEALAELSEAGIKYRGWTPNFLVPQIFAGFGATVHVPRKHYVAALPGIPTIRVFEALACRIPLLCSPWEDAENLFGDGAFIIARNGADMTSKLRTILCDHEMASAIADAGYKRIVERHTCAHRVDELLGIYATLKSEASASLMTNAQ
jgi:spore maturation protein CgeB